MPHRIQRHSPNPISDASVSPQRSRERSEGLSTSLLAQLSPPSSRVLSRISPLNPHTFRALRTTSLLNRLGSAIQNTLHNQRINLTLEQQILGKNQDLKSMIARASQQLHENRNTLLRLHYRSVDTLVNTIVEASQSSRTSPTSRLRSLQATLDNIQGIALRTAVLNRDLTILQERIELEFSNVLTQPREESNTAVNNALFHMKNLLTVLRSNHQRLIQQDISNIERTTTTMAEPYLLDLQQEVAGFPISRSLRRQLVANAPVWQALPEDQSSFIRKGDACPITLNVWDSEAEYSIQEPVIISGQGGIYEMADLFEAYILKPLNPITNEPFTLSQLARPKNAS